MIYDETPIPRATIDDLDQEAFAAYYQRIYERPLSEADIPLPKMLENMRFLKPDLEGQMRLSVAGLLCFAKAPQEYLYHARISAARWAGTIAGEDILDRQEIGGRLPGQIQQAEAFILRNTRLSTHIEGMQQQDVYQ